MIARIKGILLEAKLTEIIVDVNGIGYRIFVPMSTFDKLPREGGELVLHTSLQVREDAMDLYGFATPEEKELFAMLLTVNGIGAKLALNILSSVSIQNFCVMLSNDDTKNLSRIKGLGKKTAERLALELKSKIKTLAPEVALGGKPTDEKSVAVEEAVLALVQLGFKQEQAMAAVREIAAETTAKEISSENLIRLTLASLNR